MERIAYFLGANTPSGFASLYPYLYDPGAVSGVYLLKGGPGCGKSTLMGKIAARCEGLGEPCEYILCSGDPSSLDAVILPRRGVVVADATAPHILEPTYPGVVEHYVNLGDCYNRTALQSRRAELIACTARYRAQYPIATQCIKAAQAVLREGQSLLETDLLQARCTKRAHGILARECKKTGGVGTVTRRFLGGVTCLGQVQLFASALAQCPRIYELVDTYGLGDPLLAVLLDGAVSQGYHAVACPDPLSPDRLAHVLLPELGLGFVSSSPALPYPQKPYRRIRVDAMIGEELLRQNKGRLRFVRKVSAALLGEGIEALKRAKAEHDALEALYAPSTDFGKADAVTEALCADIFG